MMQKMFLKGFSGDVAGAQARASMVASEAVGNVRTVAAFNAEDKIVGLFQRELQAPLKRGFLRGQAAGIGFGVSQLFLFGSFALALWYGAQLVKRGEAKFNHVLEVYLVLMVSSYAIAEALGLTPDILKGGQALDSVFRVLDRRSEIDADDPNAEVVGTLTGDIEYQDVAFTYPNRPDVQIFWRDSTTQLRVASSSMERTSGK
jgi:ATP-binding cassette subfamily B (MDR/TAP) protein 1